MNNAYTPNNAHIPVITPPRMVGSSGHRSALKIILAIFALMVAVLLGLIVLLLIGSETGPIELIIGMICATLPVPIYIMLLLWIDRYEIRAAMDVNDGISMGRARRSFHRDHFEYDKWRDRQCRHQQRADRREFWRRDFRADRRRELQRPSSSSFFSFGRRTSSMASSTALSMPAWLAWASR